VDIYLLEGYAGNEDMMRVGEQPYTANFENNQPRMEGSASEL
jgi:hypothetical protein